MTNGGEPKPDLGGDTEGQEGQEKEIIGNTFETKESAPVNQGKLITKYLEGNQQNRILTNEYNVLKEELKSLQQKLSADIMEELKDQILQKETVLHSMQARINELRESNTNILDQVSDKNKKEWLAVPSTEEMTALEDVWMQEGIQRAKEEDELPIVASSQELRESASEIVELENMFELFKSKYPLEELHLIENLTDDEALTHPIWRLAKESLAEISTKFNIIKKETDITSGKVVELQKIYKTLSQAVGIRNKGKVDHTR